MPHTQSYSVTRTSSEGILQRESASCLARGAAENAAEHTIAIDPEQAHQRVHGFGAAFTDAACFMIQQMPSEKRGALLEELFAADRLGLSFCRTCVGQSDYGVSDYSYAETPEDMALESFTLAYDETYILPTLRAACAINPNLFLFASPWSPPGWMKTGGKLRGGWMRSKYLAVYADYFVKYLQGYAAAGVPIQAATVQNEVETDQKGLMAACLWSPDFEAEFVRDHLSPKLRAAGLDTKLWLLDHNYLYWERVAWQLRDAALRDCVDGVAWHPYEGTPDMMSRLRAQYPDIDFYWTEGGPNLPLDASYTDEWVHWGGMILDALTHSCSSFTGWNLALDEAGGPNLGPFQCAGLVTIDSKTHDVLRSGQFHAIGHFSRFLRPGARRIETAHETRAHVESATDKPIRQAAFRNPDGQIVLVIVNPGPSCSVLAQRGHDGDAYVHLPAASLATIVWEE